MNEIKKVSKAHTPEVMTQEAIYSSMTKEVKQIASQGWNKIKLVGTMDITMLYDLGELVLELTENNSIDDKSKLKGIAQLASYWSMGPQKYTPAMLYNLRTVPETFEREFFISQLEKPMSNGELLNWSHFVELQKLEDQQEILDMLDTIRNDCLSSRDLKIQIEGEGKAKVKRFGGRKPKMPSSPTAALRKFKSTLQKSDNYVQAMMEKIKEYSEMPLDSFDTATDKNISDVLQQIDKMLWDLKEAEPQLKALQQRLGMASEKPAIAAKPKLGEPMVIEAEAKVVRRGRPRKVQE
jgi:hypothetical protein